MEKILGTGEWLTKYNVNLNELYEDYDLVVFRCKGCAEDLDKYNPYCYDDHSTIPLNKIKVIIVDDVADCENNEDNIHRNPQACAPIPLYNMKKEIRKEITS